MEFCCFIEYLQRESVYKITVQFPSSFGFYLWLPVVVGALPICKIESKMLENVKNLDTVFFQIVLKPADL
jgi:hypothetical protein